MTYTKTYCDHCGIELSLQYDYCDEKIETLNKHFNVDLCVDCVEKLNALVKDFICTVRREMMTDDD